MGIVFLFIFVIVTFGIRISADESLPQGVEVIEITDWTKTREPEQITDENEKKLNSESDRAGQNFNISDADVESIDELFFEKSGYLKEIFRISKENNKVIKGDKVLRTRSLDTARNNFNFNLKDLRGYLKSDKEVNWQEDSNGIKNVYWNYNTVFDENKSTEWRMLSGKFYVTRQQYEEIINQKAIIALGVRMKNENKFKLIIPYDGFINVFLNNNNTSINYTNKTDKRLIQIDSKESSYKKSEGSSEKDWCKHTNGSYIDSKEIAKEVASQGGLKRLIRYKENDIEFLIGNLIDNINNNINSSSFSKLELFLIERPKIEVDIQFYKHTNDGRIFYYDDENPPDIGENVYMKIDITNYSDKINLENLNLNMCFNNDKRMPIHIDSNNIEYKKQDISNDTKIYLDDDFKNDYSINQLKTINHNQKISIVSDKLEYTPSLSDVKSDFQLKTKYKIEGDYLNGEVLYLDDEVINNKISKNIGSLNISLKDISEDDVKKSDTDNEFIVKLKSDNSFINLLLEPDKSCKIRNLKLNKDYNIEIFLKNGYQIIDTNTYKSNQVNKINLRSNNYYKNIEILIKKNKIPCFTGSTKKEIVLNLKE